MKQATCISVRLTETNEQHFIMLDQLPSILLFLLNDQPTNSLKSRQKSQVNWTYDEYFMFDIFSFYGNLNVKSRSRIIFRPYDRIQAMSAYNKFVGALSRLRAFI